MIRRAVYAIAGVVLIAGLAIGLVFLVTPSAGEAASLVQAEAGEHGTVYPGAEPPRRFAEALIATEDHRFYSPLDPGIDPFAVVRVIAGWITGRGDQGGSTIEQQLAKMLYTPGESGPSVELEQVALAIKLDFAYSKAEILSMYAEVAYFGGGHFGLEAASCGYFGRRPGNLTWGQAATLAGVVNAPTAYDPRTHPLSAREREAHVLARLVAVGDLSQAAANAVLSRSLGLVPAGARSGTLACLTSGTAKRLSGR